MFKNSGDTAVPFALITRTDPVVGATFEIELIGITNVVPFVEVAYTILFRQNLIVTGDGPNPIPVIVKFPLADKERVEVENPVIDGAKLGSISKSVSPLSPIEEPAPD